MADGNQRSALFDSAEPPGSFRQRALDLSCPKVFTAHGTVLLQVVQQPEQGAPRAVPGYDFHG